MRGRVVLLVRVGIVVAAIALSVARFLAIDADSHSASDTVRPWIIETALIALVAGIALIAVRRLEYRSS